MQRTPRQRGVRSIPVRAPSRPRRALALLLGAALAGCAPRLTPPARPAESGYAPDWMAPLPHPAGAPAQRLVLGRALIADWWTLFRSPALDRVVQRALTGSPDLAAAQATLKAAQEIALAARGALYPHLDAEAGVERQRQNYAAFGLTFPPTTFTTLSIGPSVSYALDLFGKNRHRIEERVAEADLARYRRDATYLALTGNVVSDALMIAEVRAEIEATTAIVRDDTRTLALARERANAGVVSDVDVAEAEAALANDQMALPPLRKRSRVLAHSLSILVGEAPADWRPPAFSLSALQLPAEIPMLLPSRLVHRRPDILAAEARLHAAAASVGVASAALYPDITLSGGIAQMAPAALLSFPATVWNVTAGLTAPLFHGGTLAAQKRAAQAAYVAAGEEYRNTILHAFAQVADALDSLRHDSEQLREARRTLRAADRALDLTRQNYAVGALALLDLLSAERVRERAMLTEARARAARYLDTAHLFLAMGGGWWKEPALRSSPASSTPVERREDAPLPH